MENKLKQIFVRLFGVAESSITADSSPASIPKWDSLVHMNLVVSIEEEFQIQLSDDEIPRMTSFGVILDILKSKV
jgi:acyl carrier protein